MPRVIDNSQYDLNKSFTVTDEGSGVTHRYSSQGFLQGWWKLNTNVSVEGNSNDSSPHGRTGTFDVAGYRPSFLPDELIPVTTGFTSIQKGVCRFEDKTDPTAGEAVNIGADWNNIIGNGTTGTSQMTFAAWVWVDEDGTGEPTDIGRIFSIGSPSSDGGVKLIINHGPSSTGRAQFSANWDATPGDQGLWYSDPGVVTIEEWQYVVITYNPAGGTDEDPQLYVNGVGPLAMATQGIKIPAGNFKGISTNYAWIGSGGSAPQTPIYSFTGNIADLAIWNKVLTGEEISAIYTLSQQNFPDEIRSGYVNNPARTIIHTRDNATGSYPTINRDTGFHINQPADPFVDNRALDFGNNVDSVAFPFVLSKFDKDRYYKNWVDTPNTPSTIAGIPGKPRPGVSDQGLKRSVYQAGGFTPFDESRIYLNDSSFYLTGTKNSVMYGFSSRLADKMQIKVNLNTSTPTYVGRWNSNEIPAADTSIGSGGEFDSEEWYGIKYFNFTTNEWDDAIKTDPVNASTRPYVMYNDFTASPTSPTNTWPNGHSSGKKYVHKSYQFAMSDHTGFIARDYDELVSWGYDKIGTPTVAGLAPFHNFYHAPEDNQLDMSGYIDKPFLLEKAVIEIPVTVRRRNGNKFVSADGKVADGTGGRIASAPVNGSNRDIDNYVFFLYRQRNRGAPPRDGASRGEIAYNVSGSERFLIMSASVAFYNGKSFFSGSVQSAISTRGLPHTPAFSHDFDMDVYGAADGGGGTAAGIIGAFTGTLRIEMTAAVSNELLAGGSRFSVTRRHGASQLSNKTFPTQVIQDYWPGGAGVSMFNTSSNFSKKDADGNALTRVGGQYQDQTSPYGANNAADNDSRVSKELGYGNTAQGAWGFASGHMRYKPNQSNLNIDVRPRRNITGFSNITNAAFLSTLYPSGAHPMSTTSAETTGPWPSLGISVTDVIANSTVSPYLLLPGDSLVIGIDPGVSCPPLSGSGAATFPATAKVGGSDRQTVPHELYGFVPYTSLGEAMSGSYMRIETGKASITLFGSQVRAGVERLPELNQNLTSDAIHEALHSDNPVLDQYDIASKKALTGSYIDNLIFGGMNNRDGLNISGSAVTTMQRRVYQSLGSGERGIQSYYADTAGSGLPGSRSRWNSQDKQSGGVIRDRYGIANWNQAMSISSPRKSLFRGVRLFDESETIYDTIMPDLVDWARRSGMAISSSLPPASAFAGAVLAAVKPSVYPIVIGVLNGNLNETAARHNLGGGAYQILSNKKAAPYATRVPRSSFSRVRLRIQLAKHTTAYLIPGYGNSTDEDSAMATLSLATLPLYYGAGDSFKNPTIVNSLFFKQGAEMEFVAKPYSDTAAGAAKDLTPPGARIRVYPAYVTGSEYTQNATPAYRIGQRNHQPYGAQGFLYGIENIIPTNTSAVFRWDSYGQFRDMLEQRRDGKFMTKASPPQTMDGSVQCVFVDRIDGMTEVPPYQTYSSNTNTECTASLPSFDGKSRNRSGVEESSGIITIVGADSSDDDDYTMTFTVAPIPLPEVDPEDSSWMW